jgi:hypothetical protein
MILRKHHNRDQEKILSYNRKILLIFSNNLEIKHLLISL